MDSVLIVGAGQAGASVAEGLRKAGHAGPITLIGDEPVPPYQRPPLSKAYLLGDLPQERLLLRPPHWYRDNDVALRTGTRVAAIDPDARRVTLASGEMLAYRDLVLATGARPRTLPADLGGDLGGVHVMRSLADADALAPRLVAGHRVLIVGGGYIGLEAAAVAAKRGLHVTLIEAAPRILGRVAAPVTADWFRDLHAAHGVQIREGTGLASVEARDGAIAAAILDDGTRLPVDVMIAGIGIVPDTGLARAAGLALDNGIAVDALGRTSNRHVWAAGDCASFEHDGIRIRLESVGNAIDQGHAVAANICGADRPYRPTPWFWSDQYDVKLQIAGLNAGWTDVAVRPGATDRAASHWYFADGRLIAVDAMNEPRAYMVGKRLIEAGRSPGPAAVADPATELKALLAA